MTDDQKICQFFHHITESIFLCVDFVAFARVLNIVLSLNGEELVLGSVINVMHHSK